MFLKEHTIANFHIRARVFIAILGLFLLDCCSAGAQDGPIPAPLQGVTVAAVVTYDQAGRLTYRYLVSNPSTNNGQIWRFAVEITQSSDEIVLDGQGLINGPLYTDQLSQIAQQRAPMVPVAIDGPLQWIYGQTYDVGPPLRGLASWGSSDQPYRILPNHSLDSFTLTSPGLPAIRAVEIEPAIDLDNLPPEYVDDPENFVDLRKSLIFRTVTVGPQAPKKNASVGDLFNYLIGLVNQSRSLGWIRNDDVQNALLAQLNNAKSSVLAGDRTSGRNVLSAFLNYVSGSACQSYSCPGAKPIYSEAYSLLYFNGKFLFDSL